MATPNNELLLNGGNVSSNGSNGSFFALPTTTVTQQSLPSFKGNFDISESSITRAVSMGNVREDILTAYQTFISGVPTGRGGQYAVDAQRRYGYASIRDAAAGYLQAAGLAVLKPIQAVQTFVTEDFLGDFFELPVPPDPTVPATTPVTETAKNPLEVLADAFQRAFGAATNLQPLQSQAYGYTPVQTSVPTTSKGGGGSIGTFVVLGVVGIIIYFVYKRYA